MKLYVFITTSLKVAGGSQCYTAAKAKYLEEEGWKVLVFFEDRVWIENCLIEYCNKYLNGGIIGIANPPLMYPGWLRNKILHKMIRIVGDYKLYDKIIIESHENAYSQWGEILASRINAKHFVFLMNERFRGPNMEYDKKMDFYLFKYGRKEIIGGKRGISRLFEGFCFTMYEDLPDYLPFDEAPIQDVNNEKVNSIVKGDWNICYIGRGVKSYVPKIIKDVGRLAGTYPNKKIQLLFVGIVDMHNKLIGEITRQHNNLRVIELGFLHPIPQSLFEKVDVVIAGSGSARHSAESGAIVVVANPETNMSNGIFGYETMSVLYQESDAVVSDFYDALIRVLVNKVYLKLKNNYISKSGVKETVQKQFELFDKGSKEMQFYSESLLVEGKKKWKLSFVIFMHNYFPRCTRLLVSLKHGKII